MVDALIDGIGWCMVDALVYGTELITRLFGQVIVTGYLYRFGAWLIICLWYRLRYKLMYGTCLHRLLVHVYYRLIGTGLQ
jgi:hypothetical protein